MKMIHHEDEAQNRRLKTLRRLAEQFEESSAIALVTENRLARVASRAKMVDGIFKFYAQRPRHCFRVAELIANVKCLDLTPPPSLLLLPVASTVPEAACPSF